jgi:Tetracyclin repressor-like, C-terminal domain
VSYRRLLFRLGRGRARHSTGPARDRIAALQSSWTDLIASGLREAQDQRQLDPHASIEQLTFEINALLAHANTVFMLQGDLTAFDLARRAIRDLLNRSTPAQQPHSRPAADEDRSGGSSRGVRPKRNVSPRRPRVLSPRTVPDAHDVSSVGFD